MSYKSRLAVALLGCATMFHAEARLLIPQHAPVHALTVTMAPSAPADYAAMQGAAAWRYPDGEPWRLSPDIAQQFDYLMAPQNSGIAQAAFGHFGAGAGAGSGLMARQPGPGARQMQADTVPAPIPEPGHYHLMLIGIGLLCLYGGRRGSPTPWRLIHVEKKQPGPLMVI